MQFIFPRRRPRLSLSSIRILQFILFAGSLFFVDFSAQRRIVVPVGRLPAPLARAPQLSYYQLINCIILCLIRFPLP